MGRIEKTVFISYRRENSPWAIAIYQYLTLHGYDAFYDFQSIDSGNFEKVILENIKARAHFIIVLTPSALEKCKQPKDWLRREIETAMEEKRNIVPLMMDGFDFGSSLVKKALSGKLAKLRGYNGLGIYAEYFFEGMNKLCNRFLNVALEDIQIHSLSREATVMTESQKADANVAKRVEQKELSAQEWFERGYVLATKEKRFDEAIRCFSKSISLNPKLVEAYHSRGTAYKEKGAHKEKDDLLNAIKDYTKAIKLKPNYALSYGERGGTYADLDNLKDAIKDCSRAIQIDPNLYSAYHNRAVAFYKLGELGNAIKDFTEAIRLEPNNAEAYKGRGTARDEAGDPKVAIEDFTKAIRIKPDFAVAYYDRGVTQHGIGRLNYAIRDYTKTIRLKPDFSDAYHNRGLIYESRDDLISAIADFQKYLDLGGQNKKVIKWIKNLKRKLSNLDD